VAGLPEVLEIGDALRGGEILRGSGARDGVRHHGGDRAQSDVAEFLRERTGSDGAKK
jgi:hypothetical protein